MEGEEREEMVITVNNLLSLYCMVGTLLGEGNGTPLQYSCLENPMDGGAWQAADHGVARVGHDRATSLSLFTFMHWRRKWQPTPVFLPGESQGCGSRWAAVSGVTQSQTRLKRLSSSSSSNLRRRWTCVSDQLQRFCLDMTVFKMKKGKEFP